MNKEELMQKPLCLMTGADLLFLHEYFRSNSPAEILSEPRDETKKYVYGIRGIANLFGCSIPTANRIKKSGKIAPAITHIGRKIIVDAEKALELAGRKTGGRK